MKMFSKTLARILGKDAEADEDAIRKQNRLKNSTDLIVFNQHMDIEFSESGNCGAEYEPEWGLFNQKLEGSPYPSWCPKCGRVFTKLTRAEEVE